MVPLSKLGDKVATWRRNGRVANCSAGLISVLAVFGILSWKEWSQGYLVCQKDFNCIFSHFPPLNRVNHILLIVNIVFMFWNLEYRVCIVETNHLCGIHVLCWPGKPKNPRSFGKDLILLPRPGSFLKNINTFSFKSVFSLRNKERQLEKLASQ